VHASDIDQLLSSTGPFTFFAPSDSAFQKLEKGMLEKLFEPQKRSRLADLLSNHIVKGKIGYKELKDGEKLITVNGRELNVQVNNGTVKISDIPIQPRDAKILNGVLHVMDSVII
jgi:uncharacterized surface protein with fasciclin (FAS1) repeats